MRENLKIQIIRIMKQFMIKERRAKEFERFSNEYQHLEQLENEELLFEYIQTATMYERRKWGLGLFAIIEACEILILPRCFHLAIELMLQYADMVGYERLSAMKISGVILTMVVMFIAVSNGIIVISGFNDASTINRRLQVIEEVKNRNAGSKAK